MNTFKFMPEGWNEESINVDKDIIKDVIGSDQIFQGIVSKCDENCNLYVNLGNSIQGIIPKQYVEGINVDECGEIKSSLCTGKVNKFVQFKVKGFQDENTIILSRKDAQLDAVNWVKSDLQVGDVVTGIVKNIKPYGAFIEIGGGVVGLVHIEDLSVARIKTPFERLKIGQKLKVMIKSIDRNEGKVILSYKELLGTWNDNAKQFQSGMKVNGIVRETEKNKNGIFIELKPNLVGMAEYVEGLEYGQNVDVYIKKIDEDKKKIKLTILR